MREFLVAMYMFGNDFHGGQGSPWYRRMCLAGQYLERWYQISRPLDWLESPCIQPKRKHRALELYTKLVLRYAERAKRWG